MENIPSSTPQKDLSQPEQSPKQARQSTTAFVRKNYQWFMLIGTIIISLTFAFRDHIQERAKQSKEAVESEKDFARVEATVQISIEQLKRIGEVLDRTSSSVDRLRSIPPDTEHLGYSLREYRDRFTAEKQQLKTSIDSAQRLADLMSNSQADLNKQLDSMRKEFEEVNTQFYDARTAETNNPNERSKLLQKAIIRKAKLQMQLDKLREHLLSTLEEQSKRDQKLAEIAGFVSYILIGVGLTISVAAQIVAKPGEAPEFKLG